MNKNFENNDENTNQDTNVIDFEKAKSAKKESDHINFLAVLALEFAKNFKK